MMSVVYCHVLRLTYKFILIYTCIHTRCKLLSIKEFEWKKIFFKIFTPQKIFAATRKRNLKIRQSFALKKIGAKAEKEL